MEFDTIEQANNYLCTQGSLIEAIEKILEEDKTITWKEFLQKLSQVKLKDETLEPLKKQVLEDWSKQLDPDTVADLDSLGVICNRDLKRIEGLMTSAKQQNKEIKDVYADLRKNYVQVFKGIDFDKAQELNLLMTKAISTVSFELEKVTPVHFAKMIKYVIKQLKWEGVISPVQAEILRYININIAKACPQEPVHIFAGLINMICAKIASTNNKDKFDFKKLIETLDERINMGDSLAKASSDQSPVVTQLINADLDTMLMEFTQAGWSSVKMKDNLYVLASKNHPKIKYLLSNNPGEDKTYISYDNTIEDIEKVLQETFEIFNNNKQDRMFWQNFKIFKKDGKIRVLVKQTLSVGGKMNIDYWFDKKPEIPQENFKNCQKPDDYKKIILDSLHQHQDTSGDGEQDFIDLEDLVDWTEITK